MLQRNEIKIGTKFKTGKYLKSIVVDIIEKKSIFTGKEYPSVIIAEPFEGLSTGQYEVAWSIVQRYGYND
jgi:hypothetical protein